MSEWQQQSGLAWRALEPFGAQIALDLSAPLTTAQSRHFVSLLWSHGFVLARNQNLTMTRQRELCGLAGPVLIREGENGYLSTVNAAGPSLSELSWHADAAYTDAPFDAIALHAVDVVDDASSTRFMHAGLAADALPPDLRARLQAARVEMISPGFDALAARSCDRPDPPALKKGIQPAIRRNPHTGKDMVWVSELQAARIQDMAWADSRDLLHAVYDVIYAADLTHEHRWRNGDFLIWDNIGLQHKRGPLHEVGKRVLQRVIVGTEGVAPHIAQPL